VTWVPSQTVSSIDESRIMNDSTRELEDLEVNWSDKELTPELLHAWRSRMRRWCARELGGAYASRMDTSDVVQESMLQVWQDWDRFRGSSVGEIKSWLFRIARGHLHKARRHHRAAKRDVFTEAGELLEGGPTDVGDPSEVAAQSEVRLNLMIAIGQLEPELREVVQHRIFGQYSFVEIGERLGLSKGEARSRFLRALRRLKHSLDTESEVPHRPR
jgi:RNA polymerase sigma-70 factor (ECF subfamily)